VALSPILFILPDVFELTRCLKIMLSNLSYFVRLSLCLLLSTGLHGGLVFYDWAVAPAESRLANAPVMVSLLPATNVASPALSKVSPPVPAPVSPNKTPHSVEAKQAFATPQPVASVSKAATPKKASKKTPIVERVDQAEAEPNMAVAPTEMVCTQPQDVVFDRSSEMLESRQSVVSSAATDSMAVTAVNNLSPVAIQRIEEGLLTGTAASSQNLIQAIPRYRSNPLPEYPYQARQKHWEGVVWLLVDVSAAGLVDDIRVEQSCGYRILDRTASRTVRRWKFTPAKRAGLPVLSQVRIPVRFHLEDD
jgi:protein TonB